GEHGVVGVPAAREDGGDARPNGTLPHYELAAPRHQRAVAHFDARHVGDGVEWPGRAFEGDAQVPAALRTLSVGTARCENEESKERVSAVHGAVAYRPLETVASDAPSIDSWPYDRHHLLFPILLLASEPRPALQPAIRAPAARVLPGARGHA